MKYICLDSLLLQILSIPFFCNNEVDIFFNSLENRSSRDLFKNFSIISGVQNENIVQESDKRNLNIFNPNNEKVTLMNILAKDCLSISEKTCLALFLNNPSSNVFEIQKRQNALKTLSGIKDFYEMDNILSPFLENEDKFLETILYQQKYETLSNEDICELLLSVQCFLKMIKKMYEITIENEELSLILGEYIKNISKIVKNEDFNNSFTQTLSFFYKKKIKKKRLGFCRNEKIEYLKDIYDHKYIFLLGLYDFARMLMLWHIATSKLEYVYTKIYDEKEKNIPYLKVKKMCNIYNEKQINDTFTLKLNKSGTFVVMKLNNVFHNNITTKALLLNVYLTQVFGIAFAKNFEITLFNKIDTQISKII